MKLRPGTVFADKEQARQWVWDTLQQQRLARFPYPPHQRIPNFAGARQAAERLFREPSWRNVRTIKVNPDSPQRWVREGALRRGMRVYVPTPRLQGGFHLLDPQRIPPASFREAATIATMARWSVPVDLGDVPELDAIVTGCVAVTPGGKRAGKGAGYSDLEFAILRELGLSAAAVATTVHDVQVVEDFPIERIDQPLSLICTPTRTVPVERPLPAPQCIEWERLTDADLQAMPILRELRAVSALRHRRGAAP
jgi:5-formyltetrahydrofolate cyclo-ligase